MGGFYVRPLAGQKQFFITTSFVLVDRNINYGLELIMVSKERLQKISKLVLVKINKFVSGEINKFALVKINKFVLVNINNKLRNFFKKDFKFLLPQLYILILIFGLILTLLYAVFPSLAICSSLFGDNFCTPAGIFIGLTASLPGYLIAGNLLSFFNSLPTGVSFLIVLLTSVLVYYFIGKLIDRARKKSISKTVAIIIASIIILLILLSFLLVKIM